MSDESSKKIIENSGIFVDGNQHVIGSINMDNRNNQGPKGAKGNPSSRGPKGEVSIGPGNYVGNVKVSNNPSKPHTPESSPKKPPLDSTSPHDINPRLSQDTLPSALAQETVHYEVEKHGPVELHSEELGFRSTGEPSRDEDEGGLDSAHMIIHAISDEEKQEQILNYFKSTVPNQEQHNQIQSYLNTLVENGGPESESLNNVMAHVNNHWENLNQQLTQDTQPTPITGETQPTDPRLVEMQARVNYLEEKLNTKEQFNEQDVYLRREVDGLKLKIKNWDPQASTRLETTQDATAEPPATTQETPKPARKSKQPKKSPLPQPDGLVLDPNDILNSSGREVSPNATAPLESLTDNLYTTTVETNDSIGNSDSNPVADIHKYDYNAINLLDLKDPIEKAERIQGLYKKIEETLPQNVNIDRANLRNTLLQPDLATKEKLIQAITQLDDAIPTLEQDSEIQTMLQGCKVLLNTSLTNKTSVEIQNKKLNQIPLSEETSANMTTESIPVSSDPSKTDETLARTAVNENLAQTQAHETLFNSETDWEQASKELLQDLLYHTPDNLRSLTEVKDYLNKMAETRLENTSSTINDFLQNIYAQTGAEGNDYVVGVFVQMVKNNLEKRLTTNSNNQDAADKLSSGEKTRLAQVHDIWSKVDLTELEEQVPEVSQNTTPEEPSENQTETATNDIEEGDQATETAAMTTLEQKMRELLDNFDFNNADNEQINALFSKIQKLNEEATVKTKSSKVRLMFALMVFGLFLGASVSVMGTVQGLNG